MEQPSMTIDGTGSAGTAEADVVVSDLHLSAGRMLTVRVKHTLHYKALRLARRVFGRREPPDVIEVPNPLEDFPYDAEFDGFVAKILAEYGGADVLRLRLNGDCLDPLAMTWKGSLRDPPYETVAVRKIRMIIAGHPRFFDALALVLRRPNAWIVISVGNHDHFLVWPRVQREIIRRIAQCDPDAATRIRFVDQRCDFEDEDRGVLYYHGMNADPHNFMDPKTTILDDHFGLKLKRPILNKPLGSHMAMELASRLKLKNPLIGRLPFERDIWKDAIRHKWGWGVYAGLMVVWFLYIQLVAMLDFRRKVGLGTVLRVIGATLHKNPVDEYAEKVLKKRDGVRVVVLGHSHVPRRVTGPDGTYINTGSWAMRLRLVWPEFAYRWKRFRWVEVQWRNFDYFLKTGKVPFARKLIKIIGYALTSGLLLAYLFISFRENDEFGDWSVTLSQLKVVAGVLLAFTVLKAAIRFFAVKPEVVEDTQFTFGLVRRSRDGTLAADLMEYLPKEDIVREYV